MSKKSVRIAIDRIPIITPNIIPIVDPLDFEFLFVPNGISVVFISIGVIVNFRVAVLVVDVVVLNVVLISVVVLLVLVVLVILVVLVVLVVLEVVVVVVVEVEKVVVTVVGIVVSITFKFNNYYY